MSETILKMSEEAFEKWKRRFEELWNILRGRVDVKSRLMLLLNPDIPETSTRLTRGQVQFIALSLSAAQRWPFLKPLKEYAIHLCLSNISLEGKGREEAIRFTGALAESKLLQRLGILQKEGKAEKE